MLLHPMIKANMHPKELIIMYRKPNSNSEEFQTKELIMEEESIYLLISNSNSCMGDQGTMLTINLT